MKRKPEKEPREWVSDEEWARLVAEKKFRRKQRSWYWQAKLNPEATPSLKDKHG